MGDKPTGTPDERLRQAIAKGIGIEGSVGSGRPATTPDPPPPPDEEPEPEEE